jgi:hypothetical protein
VIFAGTAGVDEFELNVFADVFEIAVAPQFPGIGRGRSSALLGRPIIAAAGRMGLDFIGRAPEDVSVAAIGFPARDTRGETVVGVGDAAIVFFPVGVFGRIWIGITPAPEFLDVLLALFVGGEAQEGVAFFLGDNVGGPLPSARWFRERFPWRAFGLVVCGPSGWAVCWAFRGRRLILRADRFRRKKSEGKNSGKNHPADAPHKDTSLAKRSKGGDAPIAQFPGRIPRDSRYGTQNQRSVAGLPEAVTIQVARLEFSHEVIEL